MTASAGWAARGLDGALRQRLEQELSGSELTTVLLALAQARAAARRPADLLAQWTNDRFVAPCPVDARTLRRVELELFDAAAGYEAVELSPLAPLGSSSVLAPVSQKRVVSTLRSTEVVADPTNVLALLAAERLRRDPRAAPRLAAAQRCVRAQAVPDRPGFQAHFAVFCLAAAAHERASHGCVEQAVVEQVDKSPLGAGRAGPALGCSACGRAAQQQLDPLLHAPFGPPFAARAHAHAVACARLSATTRCGRAPASAPGAAGQACSRRAASSAARVWRSMTRWPMLTITSEAA
jgi:hypothetical protein